MNDTHKSSLDVSFVISGLQGGGAQRVAVGLLDHWAREGKRVQLVTMHGTEQDFFKVSPAVERISLGVPEAGATRWQAYRWTLGAMAAIRRNARRNAPRAVLSFLTTTNVMTLLALVGQPVRVVVSERNDPLRQDPGLIWRVLRKLTYPRADVVTANSMNAVESMKPYVSHDRLAMVPNPVALPVNAADPARSTMILSVGRLVPQKGHLTIVSAFSRMTDRWPDWKLAILGDGPLRQELEDQIASLDLAGRVELPGNVGDPSPYYAKAAMFVIASAFEGLPNVLLEAMSHGLPSIVPDNLPGALEYIEHGKTGFVYRSGDVEGLTECIEQLAADPDLRERLGTAARERMKPLSIEVVARQWEALLFPSSDADLAGETA